MAKKVKFDADGWPTAMPWLRAKDLHHGDWVHNAELADLEGEISHSTTEREYLKACLQRSKFINNPVDAKRESDCGSKFCVVGWARHAWGLAPDPYAPGETPQPCLDFQLRLLQNLEEAVNCPTWDRSSPYLDSHDAHEVQEALSDFFEGFGLDAAPVDASVTAKAWRQTVRDFGYK